MKPTRRKNLGSIEEGAEYVGVSPITVRRWIAAGRITGYRAGPKILRIDLDELDAMLVPIPAAVRGGK